MSGRSSRLFLVDGSSYVYRAFFALPPLTGPHGMPTNAIYGFTTMLMKLIADVAPDYAAVVLDAPGPTFRDKMFDDYKANRPPVPADLSAQMGFVPRVAEALGVSVIMEPGVEADDVIATLVEKVVSPAVECVVVTADKDLMQLVGPFVRLWDTMRDRWIDESAVRARFGVAPHQVLDVMALMGDSVDNIPGVKGIGEKTATALICEFGSLDDVLRHLPEVERSKLRGAKKVAALLRDGERMARLSRELAALKRDVPLGHTLQDLRARDRDLQELRALFQQLGFQSLLRQISQRDPVPQTAAEVVRDAEQVDETLTQAGLEGSLAMATVSGPGPAATTPARELIVCGDGTVLHFPLDRDDVRRQLQVWFAQGRFELLAHDLKRDLLALQSCGVEAGGTGFDVMIASYLLEATASHRFGEIASEVLGVHVQGFRETPEGTAAGVGLLPRLRERLSALLVQAGLEPLFRDVEMPLTSLLAQMERRGIRLDSGKLAAMGREFEGRLGTLMAEAYALAGGEFNMNSPPQLREILFDKLGLPTKGVRKGKTGYSTDVDVLTRLAPLHPLPARILEYRALAKLKSTYIDALPAAINPATGRLHTTFNQTVAATGRLSSSDPNLQNIPIRGDYGRRIREAFVAPEGSVLMGADYSQIELRILAHFSEDPALIEAFRADQDIHTRTAAEVFGVLPGMVSADMRRAAKVINFGIIYGMGPPRLAQELGIPVAQAQQYIASYFDRYTGVRAYMQSVAAEARRTGYVSTILGRRRQVGEVTSTDRAAAQAAERAATNTPIQGSAADIIKVAMLAVARRLERNGLHAALLLQVHDELLLEVPENERDVVAQAVREEMEGAMSLKVPLRVDVAWGRSWADAH
jgi:DNA polymerase I